MAVSNHGHINSRASEKCRVFWRILAERVSARRKDASPREDTQPWTAARVRLGIYDGQVTGRMRFAWKTSIGMWWVLNTRPMSSFSVGS